MTHHDDHQDETRFEAGEKMTPEKLGEAAIKFATETAYAAAGLADIIAKKARELYEQQKAQLAEKTPEGVDPNFKQFVDAMPDQLKTFMDDAEKKLHELSERGRGVVEHMQAAAAGKPRGDDAPGAYDTGAGADAHPDAHDVVSDPVRDPAAEGGPLPPEGAESVRDAENH